MPFLFGKYYSRADLMRRIGQLSQVGGVSLLEASDGVARGVRYLEFRSGSGFQFKVALDRGMDVAGNPIGKPTSFYQGVGCNPGSLNFAEEMERLQKKIDAGAEYILTQPVYDHQTFETFLKAYQKFARRVPLLIGICPLASLKNAEFLHNEVPGMQIPEEILNRMAKPQTPELQRAEGIKIAREALTEFRKDVQGTYIMPPFNRADIALQVIEGFVEK